MIAEILSLHTFVENLIMVFEITNMKHSLYIFNCSNITVWTNFKLPEKIKILKKESLNLLYLT